MFNSWEQNPIPTVRGYRCLLASNTAWTLDKCTAAAGMYSDIESQLACSSMCITPDFQQFPEINERKKYLIVWRDCLTLVTTFLSRLKEVQVLWWRKSKDFFNLLACLLAPTRTPKYYLDQFDQNHCIKFVGTKRLPFICTLMKIHTTDYVALNPE